MSGYSTVRLVKELEFKADELGFMLSYPKSGWISEDENYDLVAIKPKDQDSLPIYARDAELFLGTLQELRKWFQGVEWARTYDRMLKVSDDTKRKRKEQDVRNRQLMELVKTGERVL